MAITDASFQQYEQIGATTYRVAVRLTDSVDGVSDEWFVVNGSTLLAIRTDLTSQIAARNDKKSVKSVLDGIAVGTAIPVTPTPKTQTQLDLEDFRVKYALLSNVKAGLARAASAGVVVDGAASTAAVASLTASAQTAYNKAPTATAWFGEL